MSSPFQEIIEKIDFLSFVQRYILLEKRGNGWWARCPFHGDKNPSLKIDPLQSLWFCFGCKAGGNLFDFHTRIENIAIGESLEILALENGVVLNRNPDFKKGKEERINSYKILDDASVFFEKELWGSPLGKQALSYLHSRGLKEETLKFFRLGLSPKGYDHLTSNLKNKGIKETDLVQLGLSRESKTGKGFVDFFHERIMIPIRDPRGRIISFTGRIFLESTAYGGKYVNGINTPLFQKGKILYNWDVSRKNLKDFKKVIVLEGNMDVLSLYQEGVPQSVAIMGTALSPYQLKLMSPMIEEILFSFDSDEAGQKALWTSFLLAEENLIESRVLSPEPFKDIDELIRKNPGDFKIRLDQAPTTIDYYLARWQEEMAPGDHFTEKTIFLKKVKDLFFCVEAQTKKDYIVLRSSKHLGLRPDQVLKDIKLLSNLSTGYPPNKKAQAKSTGDEATHTNSNIPYGLDPIPREVNPTHGPDHPRTNRRSNQKSPNKGNKLVVQKAQKRVLLTLFALNKFIVLKNNENNENLVQELVQEIDPRMFPDQALKVLVTFALDYWKINKSPPGLSEISKFLEGNQESNQECNRVYAELALEEIEETKTRSEESLLKTPFECLLFLEREYLLSQREEISAEIKKLETIGEYEKLAPLLNELTALQAKIQSFSLKKKKTLEKN